MCVCVREREREIINDADDVAAAASADDAVVIARDAIANIDLDVVADDFLLLMLLLLLFLLLMLPGVQLLQRPIKNVAALEAPIILAKNLHKGIVFLAVAVVSF